MKTKFCPKCSTKKTTLEFHRCVSNIDGFQTYCILCRNRILNKYQNQKYATDPLFRQKAIANSKQYARRPENIIKINQRSVLRYKTDINVRISRRLRSRTWDALKGNIKSGHIFSLLGCDIEDFKKHLQARFQPGMSFENYGKWHIDHILPCASFDLSKPEEQKKCFHYTNLQPLWARDNLAKRCK